MSAATCHIARMADDFDMGGLRLRLQRLMEKRNVRPTTLSMRIGNNTTLVKDLLERSNDVKVSTIFKLADALDVSAMSLIEGDIEALPGGPTVFLKGEVAAGQWCEAFEWPHDDWQAMTGSPNVTADPQHRFFLRVRGDSMDQVYPDGTMIECVSTFGRAEPRPGKRVIVIRRRHDQLVEATVKELQEVDGRLWLVPKSSNPVHQSYCIDDPGDGIQEVRIAAVVVSSVRQE